VSATRLNAGILSIADLRIRINPLLAEFVLDCWDGERPQTCETGIASPFYARLREAGWRDGRDGEDSDVEV